MTCTCHTNTVCTSDTTFGKDGGVWKKKIGGGSKNGGVWKKHDGMWVKDVGTQKKVYDQCTCNDRGGCSCNSQVVPGSCPSNRRGCSYVCACVSYSQEWGCPCHKQCDGVGCGWNCGTAADGSCGSRSNCSCFARSCTCMHYSNTYSNQSYISNPSVSCPCHTQLGCHCDSRGDII